MTHIADIAAASQGLPPALPAERLERGERAIRNFRGSNDGRVTFQSTAQNPYCDGDSMIDIYADDHGHEYWIDAADGRLVQMGPHADPDKKTSKTGPETRHSVASLRTDALALAEKAVPGFTARRQHLHPLEDNKNREIYFFRWDDFSTPTKESEMPPFLQVALRADGRLASFTNTLRD
jgi:hypothetical protein